MNKIVLVVFDMAGTVVNEDNVVYKTLREAINRQGHDLSLDFVLEHGAGKEKHQAIKDILSKAHPDESIRSEAIFEQFKAILGIAYKELVVTSYDGVETLLTDLKRKNIKIALNTGYSKPIAQQLLQKMHWVMGEQYDVLVTADDAILGRPNPDMIFKAMELLAVTDASKVMKVGDSIIDIEEGKNAQCGLTIGVTTGAHSRAQLLSAAPDYVVDSLTEIRNIPGIFAK